MIAVLARADDEQATGLVRRWAARGAELLSPADFTMPGWRFVPGSPDEGIAVIQGIRVPAREIDAVLIRVAAIEPEDLMPIAPAERYYVAAEINAFLIAWLEELRCPVVNRPRPGSLCGPPWTPAEWLVAAAASGIPCRATRVAVGLGANLEPLPIPDGVVNVVGEICIGGTLSQRTDALKLAAVAGVECLAVHYCGRGRRYTVAYADPWVDISLGSVADALLALMTRPRAAVA